MTWSASHLFIIIDLHKLFNCVLKCWHVYIIGSEEVCSLIKVHEGVCISASINFLPCIFPSISPLVCGEQ